MAWNRGLSAGRLARPLRGRGAYVVRHLCRGNIDRRTDAEGDFAAIWPEWSRGRRTGVEFAMPGAGGLGVLDEWPTRLRLGFGCVDVRYAGPEAPETIAARARKALRYVPVPQRSLNPDCGFAPGGTNPIPLDETYAQRKAPAEAAARLRAEVGASDM